MSAFWRLYSHLDREGPGTAQDVIWALDLARTPARAQICDAGCGSGADSVTLAEARPEAEILAVEQTPHLSEEAAMRLARFGDRVTVRQGDMRDLSRRYDLIWCAGALYFLGVTQGLAGWRSALAPGGVVAFSEPCALTDPPSPPAERFWADYPALKDLSGIAERVAAAGYRVLGHRMVIGDGWLRYYSSLRARGAELRQASPDAELCDVLQTAEEEFANWCAAPDEIAYALLVVCPA